MSENDQYFKKWVTEENITRILSKDFSEYWEDNKSIAPRSKGKSMF